MHNAYRARIAESLNSGVPARRGKKLERASPKRSDTSVRVLAAAIEMFAERGFESTTMRDLASAVGIKAPGLYNHYRSKEDILAAALIWVIQDFNAHVLGPDDPKQAPIARLKGILERHLLYQIDNPTINKAFDVLVRSGVLVRMQRQEAQNEILRLTRVYIKVVSDLTQTIVEPLGEDAPPLKPAVNCITTMYDHVHRWYHRDGPITVSELVDIYWSFSAKILGIDNRQPRSKPRTRTNAARSSARATVVDRATNS